MRLNSVAATDIGQRPVNQDAWCVSRRAGLFVVADGMGGYQGGEIAANLAVKTINEFVASNIKKKNVPWPMPVDTARSHEENLLRVAIHLAHRKVRAAQSGETASMGTTVAAVILHGDQATIAHVGDSRVYCLRDNRLYQLTRDHSLYASLEAAGHADLPAREDYAYGHLITQALGMRGALRPTLRTHDVVEGDTFLLCTDGLIDSLDGQDIAAHLANLPHDLACKAMVREAAARGTVDNITAVVVKVA